MRTRLFVISGLAVAAVIGASSATAAVAYPKGPGDIAQPPKGGDPEPQPKPNGPGDIANPPNKPVVDPKPSDNGGTDVDYGTTMGDDEAPLDGSTVADHAVDTQTQTAADDANTTATAADSQGSSHMPVLVVVFVAALVGALLALFASRVRRHDEDAPSA